MKKQFIVTGIDPFDLLRWNKDTFYNYADEQYRKQFGKSITILDANLSFVKNGIKVKIIAYTYKYNIV